MRSWIAPTSALAAVVTIVAAIHDRMPVILSGPDAERAWLSPELDALAAKALCLPLPAQAMRVTPANPLVNKVGGDVPEGPVLLEAPAPPPQAVLFQGVSAA